MRHAFDFSPFVLYKSGGAEAKILVNRTEVDNLSPKGSGQPTACFDTAHVLRMCITFYKSFFKNKKKIALCDR